MPVQPKAGVALLQPAQLPAAGSGIVGRLPGNLNFPPCAFREADRGVDCLCHGVGRGGGGVDVVGVLVLRVGTFTDIVF